MVMPTNRKITVVAFERERVVMRALPMRCPVCQNDTELLTVRQAGRLAQVGAASIYRWIASGKAHGMRTAGGGHRVCRHSLFHPLRAELPHEEQALAYQGDLP